MVAALLALPAVAQPAKTKPWPPYLTGTTQAEQAAELADGLSFERGRSAKWLLEDHRKRDRALAALKPQRKGVVDAYVVTVALDSDYVFTRETREAAKVLSRRYDAAGRTVALGGGTGGANQLPNGSLESLTLALARVAELMDKDQDVLVLYTTSHGARIGLAYRDGNSGYGILSPARLAAILDELGIRNRLLILSACYSGVFVPTLSNERTALFTAASSDRSSFGCRADNDWTFFGDAMINRAMRKPQPLDAAATEARGMIAEWEGGAQLRPSNPQVAIGGQVAAWLAPLEKRMPKGATQPVGRPATDALK
jgi:hypothetical protein